jgi:hypothetical protein
MSYNTFDKMHAWQQQRMAESQALLDDHRSKGGVGGCLVSCVFALAIFIGACSAALNVTGLVAALQTEADSCAATQSWLPLWLTVTCSVSFAGTALALRWR